MAPAEALASSPTRGTLLLLLLLLFFSSLFASSTCQQTAAFGENFAETWGGDHVKVMNNQREVLLSMDKTSGAGFGSKLRYGSGSFHLKIKLPGNNSAGIVTAYYTSSDQSKNRHDELDMEFLGNVHGKPIILQTNVFANGEGNREQRVNLWFDPTADFHDYRIMWNPHQIVFYVDETPIRVFANKGNKGVNYPSQPMQVIASLWNGEDWATDGGKTKINWSNAPFNAHFQGFNVDGCVSTSSNDDRCSSPTLWWNSKRYQQLSSSERSAYEKVRKNYMTYDYCNDAKRFQARPAECPQ